MRPVLIAKTGETIPAVAERRGDFEDWIRAGLGLDPGRVRVVRVDAGGPLPGPDGLAGVVVTGSSAMVSDRAPWSEATAKWLAGAAAARTPILGICFGHQLLAHAMGGSVARNPRGREIGTVEATLTEAAAVDALLSGLPSAVAVQNSHVESVLTLPPAATLLASTRLDPNHAFRIGASAWGLQFHPEFDAGIVRGYLHARRREIEDEGIDVDGLLRGVREVEAGGHVLRRFAGLLRA